MANSEAVDLMSVGRHCAHPDCGQIDFLPFKCHKCGKVYCLDHRVCGCSEESQQVVVCPLCARAVIISQGEDVELVFDRHTRLDCDPSNYDKVHRKARCPAASCREKLTSTNSYTCRECGTTVCLKHRMPADHQCQGKAAAAAAASGRMGLSQSLRRMFSNGNGGGAGGKAASAAAPAAAAAASSRPAPPRQQAPARPQPAPAAASAAGANGSGSSGAGNRLRAVGQKAATAATRATDTLQSQLAQYRQRQRAQASPGAAGSAADVIDLTGSPGPAAGGAGPEACPQCGMRFATVQQLISHAETAHPAGWSSGAVNMQQPAAAPAVPGAAGGGSGLERCPHCGRSFSDPVELVAHVERQHGGSSSNCVLC